MQHMRCIQKADDVNKLLERCPNLYGVLNATRLRLAENDEAPDRFLLLRDGDIGWADLEGVVLDKKSAEKMIADFEEHGSKIPIDYHHSTEKVDPSKGGKAPAIGWIGNLEYVKGEGLFAIDVEWTDEGKADVEAKRFIYTSPAIIVDEDHGEKRIVRITSVALTNKPRTIDAKELLEAAEMAAAKENHMDPFKKLKKRVLAMATALHIRAVEHPEDEDEGIPEFPAVSADQKAVADLIEVLRGMDKDVPDDAPLAVILTTAIEALQEGTGEEHDDDEEDEDKKKEDEEKDDEDDEKAELAAKAGQFKTLSSQVKALTARIEQRDAADKTARTDGLIEAEVAANKLNPLDEEAMTSARLLAEKDPGSFTKLFAGISPYAPVARTTVGTSGVGTGGGTRKRVIAEAVREWEEADMAEMCTKDAWVDQTLRENHLPVMGEAERAAVI